jgi:hypothetical protein
MTEFQTRSEETGIILHRSMNDALNHADEDKSVWKISFTTPDTNERIRLVKTEHGWILENVYGER